MKALIVVLGLVLGLSSQAYAARNLSSVSEASSSVGRNLATGQMVKMTDTPDNSILCGFHHNDRKRENVAVQKQGKTGVEARKGI